MKSIVEYFKMRVVYLLIMVIVLSACAAGGMDTRFNSVLSETVVIDGYSIDVTVIKFANNTYDVEAKDGRFIAFTGLNEPLASQDRFRRAAMIIMRKHFGQKVDIKIVQEITPTGFFKLFTRYNISS